MSILSTRKPFRFKFSPRGLKIVLGVVGSISLFVALFGALGFRVNLTSSYPIGIWRLVDKTPERGDLVMFDFPEFHPMRTWAIWRGYLREKADGNYMPLVKRLAAVEGDKVEVTDHISINGVPWVNGEVQKVDSHGRAVDTMALPGTVQPGEVWLLSDYNPRSFDSRYFGALPRKQITHVIKPVLTWNVEF